MLWALAADAVVLLHGFFVLFVIGGALLVLWRRWAVWLHLPCAVWGGLIEFAGWICPLTPLEIHFRRLAGQAGYEGGFVAHYLLPVLYPSGLTRTTQIVLGLLVVALNVVLYGIVWRASRRRGAGPGN